MKKKQQKIQIVLIVIGLLLIISTYFYYPYIQKNKNIEKETVQKNLDNTKIYRIRPNVCSWIKYAQTNQTNRKYKWAELSLWNSKFIEKYAQSAQFANSCFKTLDDN